MDTETQAWEKQPNERDPSFLMFEHYLNLGKERSYQSVANFFGVTKRKIEYCGKKWEWLYRVNAYEEHIRENIAAGYKSFSLQKEQEKFENRFRLSAHCLELLDYLKIFFVEYDKLSDSPQSIIRLKYIRDLILTIKQTYQLADFSLGYNVLHNNKIRPIDFDNLIVSASETNNPISENLPVEIACTQIIENNLITDGQAYDQKSIDELRKQLQAEKTDLSNFLESLREQDSDNDNYVAN